MFVAPLPIGPFLIEADGRLSLRVPLTSPGFSFTWRETNFTVKLDDAGQMKLRAIGGRIPSTSDGRGRREQALAILRALPSCLPAAVRLSLLPDHRIQVETDFLHGWPTTAASLITPLVGMLMRVAPVLDLLREGDFQAG
jgi:hypothetical protein